MEQYLVKYWQGIDPTKHEEPSVEIVTARELLEMIDGAMPNPRGMAISVYEIGDCILDWYHRKYVDPSH